MSIKNFKVKDVGIVKVAYIINQYPKVSHSFIRREIIAVEAGDIEVSRFSIRTCASELVDETDKIELEKTQFILGTGLVGLLFALIKIFFTKPFTLLNALWLTFKIGWRSERGILRHLVYLAEASVLSGYVSKLGIEHLHAHFGTNSTTVAMLCSILTGVPYSFTVHGPEEFDKVQLLSLEAKINQAAFVVAVSSFGKSQLFRWCDRSYWSKIHVIHCGVDEIFLHQPQTPVPEEPRLVCVGRLCEQKGHLLLIEAAGKLAAEGLQFKLVLVGDGPLRQQIEDLIAHMGLQNHIEITGWASSFEVQQQILAARAMVLPSFAEGLPVVLMEALALSRPVISTYIAGIPELVEPGVCGWLVPPGAVTELSVAMRTALLSPVEKLEQMGKFGSQRVAQQYSAAKEAKKLTALFKSSLGQRQPDAIAIADSAVQHSQVTTMPLSR